MLICEVLPSYQHTWRASAVVMSDQVGVVVGVYGIVVAQLDHLLKSVVNEDEADQGGEALLGEAREVLHQETGVRGNQQQTEQARPQADPQAELEVVEVVVSEEEEWHMRNGSLGLDGDAHFGIISQFVANFLQIVC